MTQVANSFSFVIEVQYADRGGITLSSLRADNMKNHLTMAYQGEDCSMFFSEADVIE